MKLERKVYETRREKRTDFAIGFFGSIVLNVALAFIMGLAIEISYNLFANSAFWNPILAFGPTLLFLLPLAFNAILIILSALTRVWITFGMLAAYATAFLLALLAGVIFLVACFANY